MRRLDECSFCFRGTEAPCADESEMARGGAGCREALAAWRSHCRYLETGSRVASGWAAPGISDTSAGSGQGFADLAEWHRHHAEWLAPHPERGTPVCLDAQGRLVGSRADAERAEVDGAFPLRWLWPDEVLGALSNEMHARAMLVREVARLERLCGLDGVSGWAREQAETSLGWIAGYRDAQRNHVLSLPVGTGQND